VPFWRRKKKGSSLGFRDLFGPGEDGRRKREAALPISGGAYSYQMNCRAKTRGREGEYSLQFGGERGEEKKIGFQLSYRAREKKRKREGRDQAPPYIFMPGKRIKRCTSALSSAAPQRKKEEEEAPYGFAAGV